MSIKKPLKLRKLIKVKYFYCNIGKANQIKKLSKLNDFEMVNLQRKCLLDSKSPNPSVETLLHAFLPFKYVDHTHADAVVTITNTLEGKKRIRWKF